MTIWSRFLLEGSLEARQARRPFPTRRLPTEDVRVQVESRLIVHDRQRFPHRRDVCRLRSVGLLPDEAPESPTLRAGQHVRGVKSKLGARCPKGAEPSVRPWWTRPPARHSRQGPVRPRSLATLAAVAYDP